MFDDIEFWKSYTEDVFSKAHMEIVEKGFSAERAEELLTRIYHAVGDEFGA